jgi:hypothetical protein
VVQFRTIVDAREEVGRMHRARNKAAAIAASIVALAVFGTGLAGAGPFTKGSLVQVSGASPIAACEGDTGFRDVGGVPAFQFVNSEVEPHVMVDPSNPDIIIGTWQQDRWNNGGSEGNVTATSLNGGATWTLNALTKSSNCTGGTAANGGNFERASDPWVAISPNGNAYLMSLVTNTVQGGFDTNPDDMIVSRSTNHGATWEDPISLNRDESQNSFNDKNAITADPNNSNFVYAVWDVVVSPPSGNQNQQAFENSVAFTGDIYFSRTTNGGDTWEPGHKIFKAGTIAQTIGNQIGVLPDNEEFDGELVNVFTLLRGTRNDQDTRGFHIAVIRSTDHGATWDKNETIVDRFFRGVVIDPDVGTLPPGAVAAHRTGDINAEIAVDRDSGAVYLVWQDSRFGPRSSIAFSESLDGGLTWSTPIKVNKTPDLANNLNEQAFLPMVHVLDDGTVGVSYYDFRSNTADNGATTPTEAFISHCHPDSEDCSVAASWGDEIAITDAAFDSRRAPVARGFFLGDYVGLGQSRTAFNPFFTVTTASDPANIVTREVGP